MTAKIATYFTETDNQLKKLVIRARQVQGIEQLLLEKLSPPLKSHLRLANISGDTAILVTDSPTWSSQARFISPQILEILAQIPQTRGIREIKIRTGYFSDFHARKQEKKPAANKRDGSSHREEIQRLRNALGQRSPKNG